ncbi:GDP-mannose-dependent alpha-(1-6)-phosphatidylinositol dimannoside mannosyltransferase [bacterium HR41]|nr:GDP-mannose-dependent alpha-(1-6)-phosphatidylinositol dimannoside mannosyltransferase [bacterium HR41]
MPGAPAERCSCYVVVGIDGRSLRQGSPARGVARYLRHFLAALAGDERHRDIELRVLSFGAPEEPLPPRVEAFSTRIPSRVLFGTAALAGRPRLDRVLGTPDVVWLPAVAPVALGGHTPVVLTVHDLSFETEPRDFSRYERLWHRLARPRKLAQRATLVVVPSAHTGRLVRERWGVPDERVRLVRPGPGRPPATPASREAADGGVGLPAGLEPLGYFLVVGALEPRKRPDIACDAHALARQCGLKATLVFAGDGPLRARLRREGVVVLGRVDDALLDVLYRNALCLVCPSREEGFGFPPLEAAARGTPAVVSDIAVFEETLGDAALRFPSGDAAALAERLLEVERDPRLRDRLAAAAREVVARLSWERAAAELAAVFRAAASMLREP